MSEAAQAAPASAPLAVSVCACTYRRPEGLRALLAGLKGQTFTAIAKPRLRIIIVDSEGSDEAEAICRAFHDDGLPLTYLRATRPGISFARNAGLDQVEEACTFVAILDDDEVPEPDWLERLVLAQAASDADVVQGAVIAELPPTAPDWVRAGGFFGWPSRQLASPPPPWRHLEELNSAATNAVLVRWSLVQRLNLRFDARLAWLGSEDSLFFRTLKAAGARIVFAADARVREIVPPERARLGYLMRSEFRQGNKRFPLKMWLKGEDGRRRVAVGARLLLRGIAAIGAGIGRMGTAVAAPADQRRLRFAIGALTLVNGLGTIAGVLGVRYRHYGAASGTDQ